MARQDDQLHSEALFSAILDAAHDAIIVTDQDQTIILFNQGAVRAFGYSAAEVVGQTLDILLVPAQIDSHHAHIRAFVESEAESRMVEARQRLSGRRKDGTAFAAEVSVARVRNGGKPLFVAIVRDVTERQRLEAALRQGEEFSRGVLDSLPANVAVLDAQGVIVAVNHGWQAFARRNGANVETAAAVGLSYLAVCEKAVGDGDESAQAALDGIRAVLSGDQEAFDFEYPCHSPDEQRWFVMRARPLTNQPGRAVISHQDITARRLAEETARASEQRYHDTLENMLEGFQIIRYDWRYLFVNEAVARQGRQAREALLGRTMMECYPGIENTELFAVLHRCMAERTPHRMLNEFVFPDGSVGWFDLSIQPAPDGLLILSSDITERVRAERRTEAHLRRLAALRAIDVAITSSLDLRLALNVVVEQAITQLDMDAAGVLLLNPHTNTLAYAAGRGFRTRAIERSRVKLGDGFAGSAVLERRPVFRQDPGHSPDFTRADLIAEEGFVEYYGAPMIAKGQVVGVLEVFNRAPLEADEEWRDFLETLAGQAAIAVDSTRLFDELQRTNIDLALAYDATIEGWSRALDLRDKETEGHTQRVTELTERLARAAGINEAEIVHIRRGALLHDIGKMGVPDSILLKPNKLTDDEWIVMRRHPQLAFEMLAPIAFLRPALDIPGCHHEKWDGTGYPRGLKGEQIPIAARLFAVVDVWDALTSDRPYRPAWPPERALAYIRDQTGRHFEPRAVELFLQLLDGQT